VRGWQWCVTSWGWHQIWGICWYLCTKKKDKLDVHMKKKIPEPTNNCPPRIHFFISYLFFDHYVCIQPTNLTHKSHIYIVFSSSELHLFLQMWTSTHVCTLNQNPKNGIFFKIWNVCVCIYIYSIMYYNIVIWIMKLFRV
jgi:hypothetical protein